MQHSPTMRLASGDSGGKSLSRRVAFTAKVLASLECPAGAKDRIWVYDTRQPGLAIMVTTTGLKCFYLYRKVQGRPQRIRIGAFPEVTIDQARTVAQLKIGDIAKGADPMAEKRAARAKGMNIGELWEWFLENWAKPRKRSWQSDEHRYNNHLKAWSSKRLTDIKLADVAALHRKVSDDHSQATANRVLALLSTMFNKAKLIGWSGVNPCQGVEKFAEQSRERYLSADELPRFMAALEAIETDADWRDIFKVLLYTGARRSNVLSMRWAEVDLDASVWMIPGEKSKNKAPMPIALAPVVVDILKARKRKNEWVFPSYGQTGHLMKAETEWASVLKRAEIEGVRIHDLRRTHGSWMAGAGVSSTIIGKVLGHRSQAATAVYSRMNLDPVRTAVNNVTAALQAAAAATPAPTTNTPAEEG